VLLFGGVIANGLPRDVVVIAIPLGEVLVGPAAHAFGTRSALLVCASIIVLATAAAISTPSVRRLTTEATEGTRR
jgi:hypothetical protein